MDFLQDQDILYALKVSIETFDMIGEHSLELELEREKKSKF